MNDTQLSLFENVPVLDTEVKKREYHFDRMEKVTRKDRVEQLRRAARHFAYSNKGLMKYGTPYTVSMDDVNAELETPIKYDRSNNVNGCVFRGKMWKRIGSLSSKRRNGHGNLIGIYKLISPIKT